jgi:hypothetical protein
VAALQRYFERPARHVQGGGLTEENPGAPGSREARPGFSQESNMLLYLLLAACEVEIPQEAADAAATSDSARASSLDAARGWTDEDGVHLEWVFSQDGVVLTQQLDFIPDVANESVIPTLTLRVARGDQVAVAVLPVGRDTTLEEDAGVQAQLDAVRGALAGTSLEHELAEHDFAGDIQYMETSGPEDGPPPPPHCSYAEAALSCSAGVLSCVWAVRTGSWTAIKACWTIGYSCLKALYHLYVYC